MAVVLFLLFAMHYSTHLALSKSGGQQSLFFSRRGTLTCRLLLVAPQVFGSEREQCQVPRPLDGKREAALVLGAGARLAARGNVTPIREGTAQQVRAFL